jgi:uncharacterized membrane protein YhaH (DUF805 family)
LGEIVSPPETTPLPPGLLRFLLFFFRAEGRISRSEYVLGVGFIYAANLAIAAFALGHLEFDTDGLGVMAVAGLPSLAALCVLIAKRSHDVGLPASFVLLLFVPAVGVVWLVLLAFLQGTRGPNLYGAEPRFQPD